MTRSAPPAREHWIICPWPRECCAPSAQVPHGESAIADDTIPADEWRRLRGLPLPGVGPHKAGLVPTSEMCRLLILLALQKAPLST